MPDPLKLTESLTVRQSESGFELVGTFHQPGEPRSMKMDLHSGLAGPLRDWLTAYLLERDKATVLAKWSGAFIRLAHGTCHISDRNGHQIVGYWPNENEAWAAAAKLANAEGGTQ